MTKPNNKKAVRDIRVEAQKIANSIKVDGQTKADTTLIANGIQRGMEQFLRQQSEKTRALDKRVKKARQLTASAVQPQTSPATTPLPTTSKLPWILLGISWCLFIITAYFWKLFAA